MHKLSLVAAKPYGKFLSLTDEDKQRRCMVFLKEEDAKKCISYVSHFRAAYGYWPECNLGDKKFPVTLRKKDEFKQRSAKDVEKVFYTIQYTSSALDELSTVYNFPLTIIHNFDYRDRGFNVFHIDLSVQNVNCKPDPVRYTTKLDELLNMDIDEK